jgi:alpha-tubulin suppressor-like RCC1 family protein
VEIHDANGDVVTEATSEVTLSVAGQSDAILYGDTRVNAVNGVATFTDVSIRAARTGYQLIASAGNLPAVTSNAFDIFVGYPSKLAFIAPPTNTLGRVVMAPVRVAVQDVAGNTVIVGSFQVNIDLGANQNSAALAGSRSALTVNGVASFEDLSIDTPASYTLRATASTLGEVTSAVFSITTGAAARLVFSPPPLSARPGEFIAPAVGVRVEDAHGNRVAGGPHSITVALGSNPAGGILSGTTTLVASNGAAAFADLRIDKVGAYTLTATSTGLTAAQSAVFNVRSPLTFTAVTAGYFHSCGIGTDNVSYCWGANGQGELGNAVSNNVPEPIPVSGSHTFVSISAGRSHSCGLTATGAAYCWGASYSGQIGSGSTTFSETPLLVVGGHTFAQVTAGYNHTCGVTTAAIAYCWGGNSSGELGNGTTAGANTPVAVSGGHAFASISPGRLFTCGVTTSGGAYCWGDNANGTAGNGTVATSLVPVAISGGVGYAATSAGGFHSCGLTADGVARCWGSNAVGALGNGNLTSTRDPVTVAGGHTFASITAGNRHTCGVTTNGTGYCWGENGGYLGNGGTANTSTPSPTAGGLVFKTMSAGRFHSCGVTTSNAAYCWGDNGAGKLGDGTLTTRLEPTRVR